MTIGDVMMDDINELLCERCGAVVLNENELLSYEDLMVCEYCLDELRLRDEREYQELELDELVEYQY